MTATTKWFNTQKGYGFITDDETKKDIFVHFSSINVEGYKTLTEGEMVHFDLISTDKGYQAREVETVECVSISE